MKKLFWLFLAMIGILLISKNVSAKEMIQVHIFKSSTCSHCAEALEFFSNLKNDSEYGSYFSLVEYETNSSDDPSLVESNVELAKKVCQYFGKTFEGVPLIVIGDKYFEGYSSKMNDDLINKIITTYHGEEQDIVEGILNGTLKPSNFGAIMTSIILFVFVCGLAYFIYVARKNVSIE